MNGKQLRHFLFTSFFFLLCLNTKTWGQHPDSLLKERILFELKSKLTAGDSVYVSTNSSELLRLLEKSWSNKIGVWVDKKSLSNKQIEINYSGVIINSVKKQARLKSEINLMIKDKVELEFQDKILLNRTFNSIVRESAFFEVKFEKPESRWQKYIQPGLILITMAVSVVALYSIRI